MRIPTEIKGKHRLRDFEICRLFCEGYGTAEIERIMRRRMHPLTIRRIQKILSDNAVFVDKHVKWPKAKRIQKLVEIDRLHPTRLSAKKDTLDVIKAMREEIEGDKPLVDASTHYHVTYRWEGDNDSVQAPAISEGNSRLPDPV